MSVLIKSNVFEYEGANERRPEGEEVVGGQHCQGWVSLLAIVHIVHHNFLLNGQLIQPILEFLPHLVPPDALYHSPDVFFGAEALVL